MQAVHVIDQLGHLPHALDTDRAHGRDQHQQQAEAADQIRPRTQTVQSRHRAPPPHRQPTRHGWRLTSHAMMFDKDK
jgi:hypothetical protein